MHLLLGVHLTFWTTSGSVCHGNASGAYQCHMRRHPLNFPIVLVVVVVLVIDPTDDPEFAGPLGDPETMPLLPELLPGT